MLYKFHRQLEICQLSKACSSFAYLIFKSFYIFLFFFFQAEDGIRDLTVTGVQTCALPICHEIPHLCFKDAPDYRPDGNCRACMVEIEGERVLAASCKRMPAVGMKVKAQSERSEEHTSELQSQSNLVCRLLLEKKKTARQPASSLGKDSTPQRFTQQASVGHRTFSATSPARRSHYTSTHPAPSTHRSRA